MAKTPLTVFVPNGDSRHETAVLLVGTADEYGIDQHEIKTAQGGYFISERLADVVYEDSTEDSTEDEAAVGEATPKTTPEPTTKKTSGKKAAKNDSTEGE